MAFSAGLATDRYDISAVRVSKDLGVKSYLVGDRCDALDLKDENGGTIHAEIVLNVHQASIRDAFADLIHWKDIEF